MSTLVRCSIELQPDYPNASCASEYPCGRCGKRGWRFDHDLALSREVRWSAGRLERILANGYAFHLDFESADIWLRKCQLFLMAQTLLMPERLIPSMIPLRSDARREAFPRSIVPTRTAAALQGEGVPQINPYISNGAYFALTLS
jgi:hypothetical protein